MSDCRVFRFTDAAPALNPDFTQKLDYLKTLSGEEFDRGYMEEVAAIHDKDEKLFAQEAIDGSGDYKLFAAEADLMVRGISVQFTAPNLTKWHRQSTVQ